jgi:hypothetical protein
MRLKVKIIIVISVMFFAGINAAENKSNEESQKKKNSDYTYEIIPGEGIGEIQIGKDYEFAVKIMGQYKDKINYSDEEKSWKGSGYNIDVELPFVIGFDYLIEYNENYNKTKYPVWKLYFKNNKIVYMTLSSFIYDNIEVNNIGVSPKCHFGGEKIDVIHTLGKDYFEYIDESEYLNLYYLKKGIVVILARDEIKTIAIFAPLTDAKKNEYLKKYPKK